MESKLPPLNGASMLRNHKTFEVYPPENINEQIVVSGENVAGILFVLGVMVMGLAV
jgi:hypothetical protein